MSVYQVEQYYIFINHCDIQDMEKKEKVEQYLDDEGWSSYDIDTQTHTITVDDFESEHEADNVESALMEILNG